jgi:hypothetical protein
MDIESGVMVKAFDGTDYEVEKTIDGTVSEAVKDFIGDYEVDKIKLNGIDFIVPLSEWECVEALLVYMSKYPPESLTIILPNGDTCRLR